jgi:hypothetical protein
VGAAVGDVVGDVERPSLALRLEGTVVPSKALPSGAGTCAKFPSLPGTAPASSLRTECNITRGKIRGQRMGACVHEGAPGSDAHNVNNVRGDILI